MGYASDLEILFVHRDARLNTFHDELARKTVGMVEARDKGIFHIDMRLRPYGDAGAWSVPLAQFLRYYSDGGEAAPFERQALIKLRWFGGDAELGRRIEQHRDQFTYSDAPWDWENAVHLRRRQMRELVRPGQVNVKYSAGGIVDIEYAVQYLQLLNGRLHPEVRLTGTLEALHVLRRFQIVREPDFQVLHDGYLFLRSLIDALRIVRGDASDLVLPPEDSEEMKSLSRRLGYREQERTQSAAHLANDTRITMARVHEYFVARFDVAGPPRPDGT
jgi:glutamate-ammonia-ligase adenylyltransferase